MFMQMRHRTRGGVPTEYRVPKGTVVHINGIPYRLQYWTNVSGASNNIVLLHDHVRSLPQPPTLWSRCLAKIKKASGT
jgi:hypothetical protein